MKSIQWSSKLETGVNEIDNQHKILFKFINHLLDLSLNSFEVDSPKIKKNIQQIRTFAVKHFHAEESLMLDYNYPYYADHRKTHKEILDKLQKIRIGYSNKDITHDELIEFVYFLIDWFTEQTMNDDMKLANYIRNNVGFNKKILRKIKSYFNEKRNKK